jgi:tetratricopeptide (TPR) repeat protein
VLVLTVKQLLTNRKLAEALNEAEACATWLTEIDQNFFALYVLGMKAHIQTLLDDFDGAEHALERAKKLIPQEKQMAPFFICTFRLARFFLDLRELEEAVRAADRPRAARLRKKAWRSGKMALRNSMKCALIRTEALRLMGSYFWLGGRQKEALGWWQKSMTIGKHLKAIPALSRTYLEIGKRLLEPGSRFHELNQLHAAEYLDQAKRMFAGFGSTWDSEEVEKVKNASGMPGHWK